jgi:hypothetical protein
VIDEKPETTETYEPSADIKHGHPVGMTRTDVDEPREDYADDEFGGKAQAEMTAEDLKSDLNAAENSD